MPRSIFILVLVIIAGAVFFMYTKPAYDNTQSLAAQNAQYDAALAKANQLQQVKETLLERYNSFDPNALARLNTMVPDQVDNIRLILDLDNIATRYNMAVENVDVTGTGQANQQTSGGVVGSIESTSKPYNSVGITFATRGTYSQFKQFITDLDSSLRLVDVTSISITGGGSTAGSDPDYSYAVTLQTYWLRPNTSL